MLNQHNLRLTLKQGVRSYVYLLYSTIRLNIVPVEEYSEVQGTYLHGLLINSTDYKPTNWPTLSGQSDQCPLVYKPNTVTSAPYTLPRLYDW